MDDWGPRYCETDLSRAIVEPWSTASEAAFLAVILYWAWRLRGRYREHLFVSGALPVMFVAVVGGVLFHALRSSPAFFLLDVVPLVALLLAAVAYLCYRVVGRWWIALLYMLAFFGVSRLLFAWIDDRLLAIALSYGWAGAAMALPVLADCRRNGWRGLGSIVVAIACVAVGVVFQFMDDDWCHIFPMGTHWLWHVLAAVAVHCLLRYLTRTGSAIGGIAAAT